MSSPERGGSGPNIPPEAFGLRRNKELGKQEEGTKKGLNLSRRDVLLGAATILALSETGSRTNLTEQEVESWQRFEPKNRIPGLGVGRRDLARNKEALRAREEAIIKDHRFVILRQPNSKEGVLKIVFDKELQRIIHSAAEQNKVPASLLEAIIWVESNGNPEVQSHTGPLGIMQFAWGTAKDYGLRAFKFKKGSKPSRMDERLNPAKAIPAAARHLADLIQRFNGRQDLAVFAYHTGEGGVTNVIRSAAKAELLEEVEMAAAEKLKKLVASDPRRKNIERNKILEGKERYVKTIIRAVDGAPVAKLVATHELSVAKLFFTCAPNYRFAQYQAVEMYMEKDQGPTYWFRIDSARRLIKLYRENKVEFENVFQSMQYRSKVEQGDTTRVPKARMYAWYGRKDIKFGNRQSLEIAEQGSRKEKPWLVAIPEAPTFFRYHLRTGPREFARIAEKDPEHQKSYLYLGKPAAGCLMYLAYEYRRMAGVSAAPFHVTTLVRHVGYQNALAGGGRYVENEEEEAIETEAEGVAQAEEKLEHLHRRSGGNVQAARGQELPLHCTGLAFDVPYSNSARESHVLEFVLKDIRSAGLLDFLKEKSPTNYHIMPARDKAVVSFFEKVYDDGVEGLGRYQRISLKTEDSKKASH